MSAQILRGTLTAPRGRWPRRPEKLMVAYLPESKLPAQGQRQHRQRGIRAVGDVVLRSVGGRAWRPPSSRSRRPRHWRNTPARPISWAASVPSPPRPARDLPEHAEVGRDKRTERLSRTRPAPKAPSGNRLSQVGRIHIAPTIPSEKASSINAAMPLIHPGSGSPTAHGK